LKRFLRLHKVSRRAIESDIKIQQICRNIWLVLISLFLALCVVSGTRAEARLEQFIVQLDRLDRAELSFNNPESPFFPYRLVHFDDGLTFADYLKMQRLQEQGDCDWDLYDLAVKGFFGLYPHLLPILDDEQRGPLVAGVIGDSQPAMVERCYYFQMKRELETWYQPDRFEPIDFGSDSELPEAEFSDEMRVFAWPEHWHLTRMLGELAFCHSYPPAIRDVLDLTGRAGGLLYTNEEAIYLAARAAYHDVISEDGLVASIEFARQMGMNINDIMRLYDDAFFKPMHELKPVRGFWHGECMTWYSKQKAR
jgi:hypothetical protein